MKIFAAAMNYPQHNKQEGEALYNNVGKPVVYTKTDSALLKGGRPFFVPDEFGAIDGQAHMVVRICRLGKCIPERFAHRYYDAVTVGTDFTARELQVPIFRQGELVYDKPDIETIRAYCKEEIDRLWDEVKRFEYPHNYYVDLSQKLYDCKSALLKRS